MLRRLRHLECDFEYTPSERETEALVWSAEALVDPRRAQELWARLVAIVATVRTAGGSLTVAELHERLEGVELAGRPRYAADRDALRTLSERNLDAVVEALAGGVRIPREDELQAISDASSAQRFIAVVGPSGVGKTALARTWARAQDVLWLNAEDLPALMAVGASGPLRHRLLQVLTAWPTPLRIIIDRLDRTFSETVMGAAASLVRWLRDDAPSDVSALVTAQQQEWQRVSDVLAEGNAAVVWHQVPVELFRDEQLDVVYASFPGLRDIALRSGLVSVLGNAKMLEVVTSRMSAGETLETRRCARRDQLCDLVRRTPSWRHRERPCQQEASAAGACRVSS